MFEDEIRQPGHTFRLSDPEGEVEFANHLAARVERREAAQRAADLKAVRGSALHSALVELFDDAQRAQPYRGHTPDGFREPTNYSSVTLKRGLFVPLRSTKIVGLFDKSGKLTHTPAGPLAGEVLTMEGVLIANSRVAHAGAHVIIRTPGSKFHHDGRDVIAVQRDRLRFANVDAAEFSEVVVEDADAETIALPISAVEVEAGWDESKTLALNIELSRSDLRSLHREEFCAELLTSISLGLSRAADSVLLNAIAATTPAAFSLAAVAAKGLPFGSLRGLVGTAGAGAAVGGDGILRASGVNAELTPDNAATIIGSFSHAAVAVGEEAHIIAERLGTNGRLSVTAWAAMRAVIPDAGKFWTVSA